MMPTIQIADKPTLDTVSSNMASVKSSIENATYGLEAIKNQTNLLSNSTYGLSAIKNAISSSSGGGSVIKSVQRGTVTLSSAELSKSVTINSVNKSKSILLVNNYLNRYIASNALYDTDSVEGILSSSNTLTFYGFTNNNYSHIYVAWQVIEFV